MAIKNLRPGAGYSTNGNLRSKGIDMKPVTVGDMNNQIIPQANAELINIDKNTSGIESNAENIAENTSIIAEQGETIEGLAPTENPVFTGAEMFINLLPTLDPLEANQLWNDGGTLKVSTGE